MEDVECCRIRPNLIQKAAAAVAVVIVPNLLFDTSLIRERRV